MGAKKYVMTAARKTALKKAQQKAWSIRRKKKVTQKSIDIYLKGAGEKPFRVPKKRRIAPDTYGAK
jgi:hypothetical protein